MASLQGFPKHIHEYNTCLGRVGTYFRNKKTLSPAPAKAKKEVGAGGKFNEQKVNPTLAAGFQCPSLQLPRTVSIRWRDRENSTL